VKQLGKRLEDDHSKANDELKSIAQKLGVTLPASMDKKHQGMVDKMSKVKADNFDRAFAKDMVSDHEQDIKKFRKEADKGKSAELKQFASQTVPTLEEHLKMARDLSGSSKGAGKAASKGTK
jgi:putative membrane protein